MTRQEAIKILKAKLACMERDMSGTDEDCNKQNCLNCDLSYKQGTTGEQMEVLQMTIDVLDKDTNVVSKGDDLISRRAVISMVNDWTYDMRDPEDSWAAEHEIKALPPAQPEPCEDCVSRKAVIRLLHSGYHSKSMIEEVKELPSAHPDYDCVLKQFGDCTYDTTGCSDCVIKAKIKAALSAQPEIIRCRDCKHHWIYKCMDSMPSEVCDLDQTFYNSDFDFCSLAERKENA